MSDNSLRTQRQFERLLIRTEALTNISEIKRNLTEIDKQFQNISRQTSQEEKLKLKEYEKRIAVIRKKTITKPTQPEPQERKEKPKENGIFVQDNDQAIRDQYINTFLNQTTILKQQCQNLGEATNDNIQTIKNISEKMDKTARGTSNLVENLKDAEKKSIGTWKAYIILFQILLIFFIVNAIFG